MKLYPKRLRRMTPALAVLAINSTLAWIQQPLNADPVNPATPLAQAIQPATTQPATAQPATVQSPTSQSASASRPSASQTPAVLAPPFASPVPSTTSAQLPTVHVTSDLNAIRDQIAPSLGARTYTIGADQINTTPGGENASFQQVMLRAPGVVEDQFGQEHVRGEHANLTYRINGVLLPQPINVFGQEIDTRLIQSATLIDGSLPAQYGFHTAGIFDITTKTGDSLKSNEISLYGGSNDTLQPSFQLGGSNGQFDYFVTGSWNHNGEGIEDTTNSTRALHDYTNQQKFFGYFNYQIDESSRVSLLLNASNADFQIPVTPGLPPIYTVNGSSLTDSTKINENQNEQEYYAVLAYQKVIGDFSFQLSGFTRYGELNFKPDPLGDLIFQGVAGSVYNNYVTNGVQFDSSYALNDQHTIRGGLIADYTSEKLLTSTSVFPDSSFDPMTGMQISNDTQNITDDSGNRAMEAGLYLQDEWRLTDRVTMNYGLRYDRFDANFDHEGQLSPRINFVLTLDDKTTVHAGYARYFVPPPVQNVSVSTLEKFEGTTNAPNNLQDDAPRVERSNYFDLGITRQVTKPWQLSLDGFYKQAKQLVDLGQFGDAVILSPYNYNRGTVYGAELGSTYKEGGFSLFGNFSWVVTSAHDIDTQQFEFESDELAYIQDHDIKLDHESEFTGSAGTSYTWKNDMVYADFLYGNGLRAGFANLQKEPQYYPLNVGYEHIFHLDNSTRNAIKLRFDIVNVFDESYQIRSGSGLGVAAPSYGERRGFFVGLSYNF